MKPWEEYQDSNGVVGGPDSTVKEKPWVAYQTVEASSPALTFLNQGIANVVAMPGDVVRGMATGVDYLREKIGIPDAGIRFPIPLATGQATENVMRAAGVPTPRPGEKPKTFPARLARATGETAAALPLFAGASRAIPALQPAYQYMLSNLGKTLGGEALATAGAATGGHLAQKTGNERFGPLAEMAGGISAASLPQAIMGTAKRLPLTGTAMRAAKAAVVPFTKAGGEVRASRRLRDLSADPEAAAARIQQGTIGDLSPAQASGEEGLMALERTVLEQQPKLKKKFAEQSELSIQKLRSEIMQPAEGVMPGTARTFIETRRERLLSALDARLKQAVGRVRERVAEIKPTQGRVESSGIVREELNNAYAHVKAQEAELWDLVPQDLEIGTGKARAAYKELYDDLPRAQREHMPDVARRLLGDGNEALAAKEPAKELQGLRSELLEQSRIARAAGQNKKARISDILADAILDDFDAVADVSDPLAVARNFTRDLSQRFKQGDVGRILGHAREGGDRLPAELTLETTVGKGGVRGSVALDNILKAVERRPGETLSASEQFLRDRFMANVVDNGQVNARSLRKFQTAEKELLSKFPVFNRQLTDLEGAQRLADSIGPATNAYTKGLRSTLKSRGAQYLASRPGEEFDAIVRSNNPGEMAREIMRQAAKDTTGQAARDLKGNVLDYLTRKSGTRQFTEGGEEVLSGRAITAALKNRNVIGPAKVILDLEEISRLRAIARELSMIETSKGALPKLGDVMEDTPASIISLIGRTLAARSGARLGHGTSGASLLTAGYASQKMKAFLGNITNDKAAGLISDAIQDPELFRSLLLKTGSPQQAKAAASKFNAWIVGPGSRFNEEE